MRSVTSRLSAPTQKLWPHRVQMFTSRTKFEERIVQARSADVTTHALVSRKFEDILVYSRSLIAMVPWKTDFSLITRSHLFWFWLPCELLIDRSCSKVRLTVLPHSLKYTFIKIWIFWLVLVKRTHPNHSSFTEYLDFSLSPRPLTPHSLTNEHKIQRFRADRPSGMPIFKTLLSSARRQTHV